ncbi:glycosyltransferase [Microvirga massiliensis]|uniref:glycosyltransferase n=1 Tax=Microvirga massiliensis TaxID=1033741 RepID=UPI000AA2A360|nr:glycosyltransferase [Microvirga massiliensis]
MLRVLSVAFPSAPVSPDAVGGAEQILSSLDRALVMAGHESLVIACEGSQVAGRLIPVPASDGLIDAAARQRVHAKHREAITHALTRNRIDLVHLHGIDFWAYLPAPGVPVLVTLHLPPSWYPREALSPNRSSTWLHCVSPSQHRMCPPSAVLLPPIENGVSVEEFARARHAKRTFALALGRICPEKGYHVALDAAHHGRRPLLIAGQVYPYGEHHRYFHEEIEPRLDRHRRFLGPVGFARKRRLLAATRALLIPSLVEETSSLVAMEALASGTPVIALPNGALADIVEHGRTGFLVRDAREMSDAIEAAGNVCPERCRKVARERFSIRQMVDEYLRLYRSLAT